MSDFRTYVTQTGFGLERAAKLNNTQVDLAVLVVGDGVLPDSASPAERTDLIHQVREYALTIEQDERDPNVWIARAEIPASDGGFFIKEAGIKTTNGELYSYARQAGDYKPLLEEGQGKSYTIRLKFVPGNADAIQIKIDPSVQFATPTDLDNAVKAHKTDADPHPQYLNNVVRIASSTSEGGIGFWRISHGTEGEKPVGMIEGVMIVTSMGGDFSQEFHSYTDPSVVARRFYKQGNFTEFSYEYNTKNLLKASGDGVREGSADDSFITPLALQAAGIRSDVGMIVPFPTMTAPPGFLKMQDGELSRTTYAALFSFALASGNMADTEADKAPGQFGPGDGITTFTLPNPQGLVVRALDEMGIYDIGREIGSYQSDAIRNITGYIQGQNEPIFQEEGDIFSGAFYSNEVGFDGYVGGNSSNVGVLSMGFDASRVVPTASENRVKSVAWPMYIKY